MTQQRNGALSVCTVLAIGAVTGCAGAGPPDAFRERSELPSCGAVALGHLEPVPPEAEACLSGSGEAGAELEVSRPTVEGDTVVTYYRMARSIDGVELFVDATDDRFGSQAWEHLLCDPEPSPTTPKNCSDVS